MNGKFVLIALACISVAQVHGDELENAINNGLRRVNAMNDNANGRYYEVIRESDYKSRAIAYKAFQIVQRARKVQESSTQAIRNVADITEAKAKENNRPQSVFQCIRTSENRANREIATFTDKFEVDIDRLMNTKQDNIDVALRPCDELKYELDDVFHRAIDDIKNCQNSRCVNTVVGSFAGYLNSMYAALKRTEGQINTVMANFQRDSNNYFTNTNRQVSRVKSTAMRAIRNCYYRGGRDLFDVQESEVSQEV